MAEEYQSMIYYFKDKRIFEINYEKSGLNQPILLGHRIEKRQQKIYFPDGYVYQIHAVDKNTTKKCNHCDFASYHVFSLRTHLKTHSALQWGKSNK